MQEKRRYPRLSLALPVTMRHQGRLIPATLLNISCGGVCLNAAGADVSSAAPVELIFDLDEHHRDVALRGRITRVEHGESCTVGIQFSNLFSESYRAVEAFLRTHLN